MGNNFGIFLEIFHTDFDSVGPRNHWVIAIFFLVDEEETLSEDYENDRKCVKTVPND